LAAASICFPVKSGTNKKNHRFWGQEAIEENEITAILALIERAVTHDKMIARPTRRTKEAA
jgi:hypothetical protein